METPLIRAVQARLTATTADEAVVCASMALQMALLRCPAKQRADLQRALASVLSQVPMP